MFRRRVHRVSPRFRTGRGTQAKWIAWTIEGSLTAENTFTSGAVIQPSDFEVAANIQPGVTVVVSIGGIVIVNVGGGPSGGTIGLSIHDAGESVAAADPSSFAALTDERFIWLAPYHVSDIEAFSRSFRTKSKAKLRDDRMVFSISSDVLGGATHGTTEFKAYGRTLVVGV